MFLHNGIIYTEKNLSQKVCVLHGNIRQGRYQEAFNKIKSTNCPFLLIGNGFEPTDRKTIKVLYDYALNLNKFNKIAAFTCNLETEWEIDHFFDPMCLTPLQYSTKLDLCKVENKVKLFHNINRTPRLHRIKAFLDIRNRNLEKLGYNSFTGGLDFTGEDLDIKEFLPDFPIILDVSNVTPEYIHNDALFINNPIYNVIQDASIGVIAETNYYPPWHPFQWEDFFISEKTFTCFSLLQIPIIIGNPGSIKWLKEQGFYTFDNVIDNSYDEEPNPDLRIQKAISELEKLKTYNPQDLYLENEKHLKFNRNHLVKLYNSYNKIKDENFSKWLEL